MKMIQTLLVCLFSLTLIVGCGDIENASDSVNPSLSAQVLPTDDDIQGLYNMEIPHNQQETAMPAAPAFVSDPIVEKDPEKGRPILFKDKPDSPGSPKKRKFPGN